MQAKSKYDSLLQKSSYFVNNDMLAFGNVVHIHVSLENVSSPVIRETYSAAKLMILPAFIQQVPLHVLFSLIALATRFWTAETVHLVITIEFWKNGSQIYVVHICCAQIKIIIILLSRPIIIILMVWNFAVIAHLHVIKAKIKLIAAFGYV